MSGKLNHEGHEAILSLFNSQETKHGIWCQLTETKKSKLPFVEFQCVSLVVRRKILINKASNCQATRPGLEFEVYHAILKKIAKNLFELISQYGVVPQVLYHNSTEKVLI